MSKGYVSKLESNKYKSNSGTWYIPHFAVYNVNKPGKIRLVFDAAASSEGTSLNDVLLPGPDLLKPLTEVLFKFRQKEVGFGGDIQKMFHRVLIPDEDTTLQRFLWRDREIDQKPDIYEMKAMTFGSTSSPCSAQYVNNINALDYAEEFPEAAKAITDRHYVDDYFNSVHTDEDAIRIIKDVIEVHGRRGFLIRNWTCNSNHVLQQLSSHLRANKNKNTISEDKTERVLGMNWNANDDTFTYSLNFSKVPKTVLDGSKSPIKREMLKVLMSLYDPLGFLTNFTIAGKF